jgi:hypothetical protein
MAAMSYSKEVLANFARSERAREITQSYDAPPLSPRLAEMLIPRPPQPTTFREFLTFKPGTDFYNHRTAKGRARRS